MMKVGKCLVDDIMLDLDSVEMFDVRYSIFDIR